MRSIITEAIDVSRGSKNSWEVSKDIIEAIEEKGMQPPCVKEGVHNHMIDHKGGTYCQNRWEDEDVSPKER